MTPKRKDAFVVLGVHDGHNASACLLVNGRLVAALAEERVTRRKNEAGYPRGAIEKVLEIGGCDSTDVDVVALGSRFMHHREFFFNWDWYRKGYARASLNGNETMRLSLSVVLVVLTSGLGYVYGRYVRGLPGRSLLMPGGSRWNASASVWASSS